MTDKTTLTERMVFTATEFGVAIVKEVAKQALATNPHMTLRQFDGVLDSYIKQARENAAKESSGNLV